MTQLRNLPHGRFHIDQYQRMLRWYERFKRINDGLQVDADFEDQFDDVLAFFMNCDHLYDWIINEFNVSKSNPNIKKYRKFLNEVKDFRRRNDCLKLCADLSVGAKHLHPNRKSHFGEEIRVGREVHIDETGSDLSVKSKWKITSKSGKEYDAFEIAKTCVKKWKEFLESHKTQIQELTDLTEEGDETG